MKKIIMSMVVVATLMILGTIMSGGEWGNKSIAQDYSGGSMGGAVSTYGSNGGYVVNYNSSSEQATTYGSNGGQATTFQSRRAARVAARQARGSFLSRIFSCCGN